MAHSRHSVPIVVNAPPETVWAVITDPEAIREFGTEVDTSWKPGRPIHWSGTWEGQAYEGKGTVEPNRRLVTTHFSPLSGEEDVAENYHEVSWELEGDNRSTALTLTQDNNASSEEVAHSEQMWDKTVHEVKEIAEHRVRDRVLHELGGS